MVYLDAAATTRPNSNVLNTMNDVASKYFGNPSSHHKLGFDAQQFLEEQRKDIAQLVGARSSEIYFTSGGTESNNWALEMLSQSCKKKEKTHIITTQFEHHSILNKLKELESKGFEIDYVRPNKSGFVSLSSIKEKIKANTGLIVVMMVNNELGTIQPYEEIGALCKEKKIYFHVDAVQGAPHIILDLKRLNFTTMSVSAHKFNGPRGVGFLYIKKGIQKVPLIYGGAQESGFRAGTQNLAGIAGMTIALRETYNNLNWPLYREELNNKYNYFISKLKEIDGIVINNEKGNITKTIISFYFDNIVGEVLLSLLNQDDIYASAGSACAAGDSEPSHVLKAIGLNDARAHNSIRLSFENPSIIEIDYTVNCLKKIVDFLRQS